MIAFYKRATHALAAVAMAAGLLGALSIAPATAAEKTPPAAESMHSDLAQRIAKHLQMRLDDLAARLQIKASQEPAWQTFAAAYRELITARLAQGEQSLAVAPDVDAAALARRHADWAAEHAQKLSRLADATAKLQQSLDADQRLVLNEVARHYAQEHFAFGHMHDRYFPHHGPHCDGGADGHAPWERPPGPHGDGMGRGGPYGPDDGAGPPAGPAR